MLAIALCVGRFKRHPSILIVWKINYVLLRVALVLFIVLLHLTSLFIYCDILRSLFPFSEFIRLGARCEITGLKQKSSQNVPQTGFIKSKQVTIEGQPIEKSIRDSGSKRL